MTITVGEASAFSSSQPTQTDLGLLLPAPAADSHSVNEAAWKFIDAMPHELPGKIFNDLKPAIHAALCCYHQMVFSGAPATPEAMLASLPKPYRATGAPIAADGVTQVHCDLYSKEQMVKFAADAISALFPSNIPKQK